MKKVLSFFLAITMLISITAGIDLSALAATSGDYTYSVLDDGTAEITNYTGSATNLIIPSTLNGYTVTSIESWTFQYCTSFASVTISDSVTSIGSYAFYNCTSLTSVIIGDSVTSIGSYAFCNCESLTSITIPDSVTSIASGVFECCTSLTSITIPNSVISIGNYAFYGCSFTSITIPDSVINIGSYAFYRCTLLESATIGNGVTSIGNYAFFGCTSLTNVTIGSNVKTIGNYVFGGCYALTNITIPDSVMSIGNYAFSSCTNLTVYYSGSVSQWNAIEIGDNNYVGDYNNSYITIIHCTDSDILLSSNEGYQDYLTYSFAVSSYLVDNEDGTLTRVEYYNGAIVVETYTETGDLSSQQYITMELSLFGGFYAGENYNFFVFGQTNPDEDDTVEVLRVVRYTKDWVRVDAASLYGANTTTPFSAGSLRMTECGDILYIRTCHKMYASSDGLNHQANMTLSVQISTMTVTDSYTTVMNVGYGYVSHSFNQFIQVDGTDLLAVDHGDAYPRSVVLIKYNQEAGLTTFTGSCSYVNVLPIQGSTGANATGVSVGGFEISDTAYLVAGNSVVQDDSYDSSSTRNIFVTSTSKDDFSSNGTTIYWITDYASDEDVTVSTPQLVKISQEKFLLLWTVDSTQLYYVFLDGEGELASEIYSTQGALSDCQPIVVDGVVTWYCTSTGLMHFYEIDSEEPEELHIFGVNGHLVYNSRTMTKEATCGATGVKTYTCTVCGATKTETIAKTTTHTYNSGTVTKAATCAATGVKTYTCTVCGATKTETIAKTSTHTYNSGTVTKAATCAATGVKTYTCTVCGATKTETIAKTSTHTYNSGTVTKAATCGATGVKTYTCTICGATKTETIAKTTSHSYGSAKYTTKATTDKKGVATYTCTVCGATKTKSYAKIKSVTLSKTSYTYNGKAKTPTVTVKDSNGNTISSKYYTVTYINCSTGKTVSSMKAAGKYYVKIKFKTKYSGTVKKAVTIKPKATSIKSVTAASKGFTVKWSKVTSCTTGYQVQYSTSKSFSSKTTKTITSNKTTSKKITGLKAKKKYYVRVRTYKTVKINGKSTKIYSSWSSTKSVTTKK